MCKPHKRGGVPKDTDKHRAHLKDAFTDELIRIAEERSAKEVTQMRMP